MRVMGFINNITASPFHSIFQSYFVGEVSLKLIICAILFTFPLKREDAVNLRVLTSHYWVYTSRLQYITVVFVQILRFRYESTSSKSVYTLRTWALEMAQRMFYSPVL